MSASIDNEAASSSTPPMGGTKQDEEEEMCLTQQLISKLPYRELQAHLSQRELPTDGTTGQLRDRLREATGLETECVINEDGMGDDCEPTVCLMHIHWNVSSYSYSWVSNCTLS